MIGPIVFILLILSYFPSLSLSKDQDLDKQYEHSVVNSYNDTMVNLGYLKDEAEGLKRSIYYANGVTDTGPAAEAAIQCGMAIKDITAKLETICDGFYGLFENPDELKDPIKSLPTVIKDKDKRQILDGNARNLDELTDTIAIMRKAVSQELSRLRNGPAFKRAFPQYTVYLPEKLPPVKVSADGTLKRLIFAGPYGRTETMLSLKFDTLDEPGTPVWAKHEPTVFEGQYEQWQTQWDQFHVPASDTFLMYALGDSMYCPPWFSEVYGNDPDYYMQPNYYNLDKPSGGFDYRHPVPRKMILEYLEGAAQFHGQQPYTFVYKGPWEAHPYCGASLSIPGQQTVAFQEHGFSKYAVEAFRNYLKDKFTSITQLNKAWRFSYKSFDDIQPPEKIVRAFTITKNDRGQNIYTLFFPNKRLPGASTTPLTYEFERCRKDLYCDYLADCYKAIKRGDPKRPVASSTSGGIMNEIIINSHDDLQMAQRCVDMWGKHPSGGFGWADSPYQYGLNRYFNKTLVALEYYGWAQEEIGDDFWGTFTLAPGTTTDSIYNAARRDTWHEYSWGRRMLLFYWTEKLIELKLPPGGRTWSDGVRPDKSPLVRPWANMVPVVKRRMTNINDILINTSIVKPRIGVLHPGVSIINAYPTNGCTKVTNDVFDRLISKQYHFGVVPEEFIVSGRDSLNNYDVIILPYVQYFDDGFGKRLLEWVTKGGTLVSCGPFGLNDKYGFEIKDGAAKVFADVDFTYPTPDEYRLSWEWDAECNGDKLSESYLVKNYGRGKVLVTFDGRAFKRAGFTSAEAHVGTEIGAKITGESSGGEKEEKQLDDKARPLELSPDNDTQSVVYKFYEVLKDATKRKAWVENGNIEMILRQNDPSGPLYVSMLNWDYKKGLDTEVVVRGEYRSITDLSVEGGFPVPPVVIEGRTRFKVVFGPGEGLMLKMKR